MISLIRVTLTIALICCTGQLFSQGSNELAPGYYVVVAAYAKSRENVAQNYIEVLKLKGHQPLYGYNSSRNLYFVYLTYFGDLKESLVDMKRVRGTGEFANAWIRVVPGDILPPDATSSKREGPVRETAGPVSSPTDIQPTPKDQSQSPSVASSPISVEPEIEVTDNPEIVQYKVMTLGNSEVFLSLYNARNNRIVDGQVDVIDKDRSKLLTSVKGNEYLVLPDPKSKSGQLTLICESFGYRKIQQEINYPLPLADTVKPYIDLLGTTLVVNFDLVRYHKGDIGTLYNVNFYNDAALMLPESKYELNSLLQLMNENSNYRIMLHGHTNGNYTGKILTTGQEKNFFSLQDAASAMGSAKDLSRARAQVIKDYMVSNGVDASRMEIKAWGGKRPLYDKNSANAKRNVRVEVEVLQE